MRSIIGIINASGLIINISAQGTEHESLKECLLEKFNSHEKVYGLIMKRLMDIATLKNFNEKKADRYYLFFDNQWHYRTSESEIYERLNQKPMEVEHI